MLKPPHRHSVFHPTYVSCTPTGCTATIPGQMPQAISPYQAEIITAHPALVMQGSHEVIYPSSSAGYGIGIPRGLPPAATAAQTPPHTLGNVGLQPHPIPPANLSPNTSPPVAPSKMPSSIGPYHPY